MSGSAAFRYTLVSENNKMEVIKVYALNHLDCTLCKILFFLPPERENCLPYWYGYHAKILSKYFHFYCFMLSFKLGNYVLIHVQLYVS